VLAVIYIITSVENPPIHNQNSLHTVTTKDKHKKTKH